MNKREAKREACWIAAQWIQTCLDGGSMGAHFAADDNLDANDADILRAEFAAGELVAELERRSL